MPWIIKPLVRMIDGGRVLSRRAGFTKVTYCGV